VQIAVGGPRYGWTRSSSRWSPGDPSHYFPPPDVSVRLGLAEGWDMGVRGRLCCALEGSVKHELLRGSTDIAVDLALMTGYDGDFEFDAQMDRASRETNFTTSRLSVLIGWIVDDTTYWVAPGLHAGWRYGEYSSLGPTKTSYSLPLVGPSLNAGVKVPLGSVTSFFVETGFLMPVAGEEVAPFGGAVRMGPRDIHVESVIGFSFNAGRLPVNETPSSIPDPSRPPSEKSKEFRWQ
jgi:hypothetical protein